MDSLSDYRLSPFAREAAKLASAGKLLMSAPAGYAALGATGLLGAQHLGGTYMLGRRVKKMQKQQRRG
tara:strand:- start:1551 stop:1754 length:204 start_codon:yes stop_codon:yes gene_type:complete